MIDPLLVGKCSQNCILVIIYLVIIESLTAGNRQKVDYVLETQNIFQKLFFRKVWKRPRGAKWWKQFFSGFFRWRRQINSSFNKVSFKERHVISFFGNFMHVCCTLFHKKNKLVIFWVSLKSHSCIGRKIKNKCTILYQNVFF